MVASVSPSRNSRLGLEKQISTRENDARRPRLLNARRTSSFLRDATPGSLLPPDGSPELRGAASPKVPLVFVKQTTHGLLVQDHPGPPGIGSRLRHRGQQRREWPSVLRSGRTAAPSWRSWSSGATLLPPGSTTTPRAGTPVLATGRMLALGWPCRLCTKIAICTGVVQEICSAQKLQSLYKNYNHLLDLIETLLLRVAAA